MFPILIGINEFKESTINEKNDWINLEVEIRREWINNKLKSCNFRILEYELMLNRLPKQIKEEFEPYKNKENEIWFKVGLLFATGEMASLFEKHKSSRRISIELYGDGYKGYRPYISSSRSKTHENSISNKNIYSSYYKMKFIIEHCKKTKLLSGKI